MPCKRHVARTTIKRDKNCLKRHRLDNSCTDIMSPLCSSYITDTRRPPAVFVGKTLTGSDIAVKALHPPVTPSPSLDRRHESILISGVKYLTTESLCLNLSSPIDQFLKPTWVLIPETASTLSQPWSYSRWWIFNATQICRTEVTRRRFNLLWGFKLCNIRLNLTHN